MGGVCLRICQPWPLLLFSCNGISWLGGRRQKEVTLYKAYFDSNVSSQVIRETMATFCNLIKVWASAVCSGFIRVIANTPSQLLVFWLPYNSGVAYGARRTTVSSTLFVLQLLICCYIVVYFVQCLENIFNMFLFICNIVCIVARSLTNVFISS